MPSWISILGFVIAPIATLVAVWMTSKFAAKNALNEKIWNRKANAYGAILEALHQMEHWYTVNLNDEMLKREPTEEVLQDRHTNYQNARKQLIATAGRESWLLKPAVGECLTEMNAALDKRYDSWFEVLDAGGCAVRKAGHKITELAGLEMETRPSRRFLPIGTRS